MPPEDSVEKSVSKVPRECLRAFIVALIAVLLLTVLLLVRELGAYRLKNQIASLERRIELEKKVSVEKVNPVDAEGEVQKKDEVPKRLTLAERRLGYVDRSLATFHEDLLARVEAVKGASPTELQTRLRLLSITIEDMRDKTRQLLTSPLEPRKKVQPRQTPSPP